MSRDIRSYFQSAKANSSISNATPSKVKKRRIISSDEDDEKAKTPIKQSKKSKVSKKNAIESDSDSDIIVISPGKVLGKTPVSRQEAPKVAKRLQKKEVKCHNEREFEDTLRQLDISHLEKKDSEENKGNKDSDAHKSSTNNEKKKTTPVKKKKTPVKSQVEKDKKQNEPKTKKPSNSSSNEDQEHSVPESSNKSKHAKKPAKGKSSASKLEVEHKAVKRKASPEKDVYEERVEKRKHQAAMYLQYLQRGGARNPGSKEIPVGAENCLAGLTFVITGVLDSLEREEAEELIKKYGGRFVQQPSKKTDYVIVGDQPGATKTAKANALNLKKISEDDLLEMIRTRPAGEADDVIQPRAHSKNRQTQNSTESEDMSPSPKRRAKVSETKETEKSERSPRKNETKISDVKDVQVKNDISRDVKDVQVKNDIPRDVKDVQVKNDISRDINDNFSSEALVEKYRPKTMKQILGQQVEKSCAKRLYNWLKHWHDNQNGPVAPSKPSPWAKNYDGAFFKAALLSGPPGVGKTTTAQVVCKELGFDLIEFNASDTRSKKLLKEEVSELLSNTSLKDYVTTHGKCNPSVKQVLLMDEVDGMAGNEDRGGLQELIHLIKNTEIPIICICNDRNNLKMRTLANYTYDLRFQKPKLEQIRGAMKSICFKENINISTEDLDRLIESTNQDIRQVINHLSLFVGRTATQAKSQRQHVNKDLKLGPWDVVRKVFSAEEHKNMSIHDKSDLFFHDYNFAPLFVQDNYLLVIPHAPKNQILDRVAECAESLALGDIVEKSIRSNNNWSLLPIQACYSSVIPGTVMSGHISSQINFPTWLGRNSKANKFNRLTQELTIHMRLTTGASKEAVNLDYLKPLRNAIIKPLATAGMEGVNAAINVMNQYHLLREDLDSLIEVSLWPGDRDPMQAIDSKIKSAFTRAYNKNAAAVPYIVSGISKKKAASTLQDEGALVEEEEEEEEEEAAVNSDEANDTIETDKMIKAKKATTTKKTESKAKNTSNKPSKHRRGRGKAH